MLWTEAVCFGGQWISRTDECALQNSYKTYVQTMPMHETKDALGDNSFLFWYNDANVSARSKL